MIKNAVDRLSNFKMFRQKNHVERKILPIFFGKFIRFVLRSGLRKTGADRLLLEWEI